MGTSHLPIAIVPDFQVFMHSLTDDLAMKRKKYQLHRFPTILCLTMTLGWSSYTTPALCEESWTFVSIPDFMNADIGTLAGYPGFPDGGKDSTTAGFEATLAFYLDAIAAENPDMVMVAGDLVEGEWHHDTTGRNIFGTYGTHAERELSLDNAANLYYGHWVDRFTSRGLNNVYPAVGDHELGDNDWPVNSNRGRLVPNFKDAFARHFTRNSLGQTLYGGTINGASARPIGTPFEDTSYAVQNKNLLLVSVDVFRQDDPSVKLDNRTGSVLANVDGAHLAWLDSLLTAANADPTIEHIIVQGHSPVLTPVRVRGSSELYLRDYDNTTNASNADKQANTDFWQTLATHDVDFYFAGEVHHNTLSISNGVTQIVSDGIPFSDGNYLVGKVTGKKIEFEIKHVDIGPGPETFWQTVGNNKRETIVLGTAWETSATATYDKSSGSKVLVNANGDLAPFGTNDGSITLQTRVVTNQTLEVGPDGIVLVPAEVFIDNHNFQRPVGSGGPGIASGTVNGWTEEVNNASTIDGEAGGNAPIHFDQTGRLHNISGAAINQDLGGYWVEGETYTLSFNGWEAGWRIGETGDTFEVELREQNGTVLWTTGSINVDGTLTGSYGNITEVGAPNAYSFEIDTDTFTDGTPGSPLNLRIKRIGGVSWFDNFTLASDTQKITGSQMNIDDQFVMEIGSELKMDLYDPNVHDRLIVGGEMSIEGGTLKLLLDAGAPSPAEGDQFDLFDFASFAGQFDSIELPALATGLAWDTTAISINGVVSVVATAPGDFNGDGVVDGADLAKWQADYGSNGESDADGDGDTDGADFLEWQRQKSRTSIQGLKSSHRIPEPKSTWLATSATMGSLMLRYGWRP